MKENKILSAEEFIKSKGYANPSIIAIGGNNVIKLMTEFAKLHVKVALESASKKAAIKHEYYDKWNDNELYEKYKEEGFQRTDEYGIPYGVDITTVSKQSILSAYPEELIK